ncbi:MAG TPA: response regulator [Candidatus Limnocylindrales bacterium]|nr:response regulator [Candidatus Limnocylindrales bacterium]
MTAINILLIDDSAADAVLTAHAFDATGTEPTLRVIAEGEAALEWLGSDERATADPLPDLILLDLNLPRLSGHQVLDRLKADPGLRQIPVVVLSSSDDPSDVAAAYAAHANSYITKPHNLTDYVAMARAIDDFWLTLAALPEPGTRIS